MDGVPKVQARTEPPAPLQLVLQPPAALPVRLVGVRLFVEQFYRRIKTIIARGQTVEEQTKLPEGCLVRSRPLLSRNNRQWLNIESR
jgi:hypothetical protein